MNITVKLHASLQNGRFQEQALNVPAGSPVRWVLADLDLPAGQVGFLLVNGQHARPDHPLAPDDHLALFPMVGGG